MWFTDWIVQK